MEKDIVYNICEWMNGKKPIPHKTYISTQYTCKNGSIILNEITEEYYIIM